MHTEQIIRFMNLRKGNIKITTIIIALMAMVVFLCVPHHHHEESICIGNNDCKTSKHHSHEDDCGGQESQDFCCSGKQYVDFRSLDDDHSNWLAKDFVHFIAIFDGFVLCPPAYQKVRHRVCLPEAIVVSPTFNFKALRSPPLR